MILSQQKIRGSITKQILLLMVIHCTCFVGMCKSSAIKMAVAMLVWILQNKLIFEQDREGNTYICFIYQVWSLDSWVLPGLFCFSSHIDQEKVEFSQWKRKNEWGQYWVILKEHFCTQVTKKNFSPWAIWKISIRQDRRPILFAQVVNRTQY